MDSTEIAPAAGDARPAQESGVAPPTRKRFVESINRLYEQGADVSRIGQYVRRWMVWVRSGLCDKDATRINNACDALSQMLLLSQGIR